MMKPIANAVQRSVRFNRLGLGVGVALGFCASAFGQSNNLRPPAVPLLTSDPYLSVWSEADHATDDVTRHWTKRAQPLVSFIRVDGDNFRILGNSPSDIPALPQTDLKVTATRTTYTFENAKVLVKMSFLTPALPNKLDVYARPVTYVRWDVTSNDGGQHKVQIYESTSSLLSVERPDQKVVWTRKKTGDLTELSAGSEEQTLLRPAGDDTRIDWGYIYAVAPNYQSQSAIGSDAELKRTFLGTGSVTGTVDGDMPRAANIAEPVLAYSFDLGSVGEQAVSPYMMIGYDEIYSIEYYGKKLRPYWRRNGATPESLFTLCEKEYKTVAAESNAFDTELAADAEKIGGEKYAQILALSYRECVAANGFAADAGGHPLLFTKENTSNGDIATVDVIFPMDPIWVLLSPTLAKASLVSNFQYAASKHWKFPNAPHDLGTYPQVFGRDDGGEGMPVEESGNMILLTDAIAHDEGNTEFADQFWKQLTTWANYLEKYGLDPEDQLCTDDFMGHLAHNANLSVKAILALAAYSDLCKMRGETVPADRFMKLAKADAAHWMEVADAGDHSLLAFDKPNTWSQKYNLVWDQILGLKVFPASAREKEVSYYQKVMLQYGVPLDSRTHLTKTDWSIWSATLSSRQSDFETIVDPIYAYLNATTARDPIADSYETDKIDSGGMHARPVVGGFFIAMLNDPTVWKKWVAKNTPEKTVWSPLPTPPAPPKEVIATGRNAKPIWHYTITKPSEGWTASSFNDSAWSKGPGGFGSEGTPTVAIGTPWQSDDIWLRREIKIPHVNPKTLQLLVFHDEDVEIYIDGVLAASEPSFITDYETLDISPEALKHIHAGDTITVAVHCHQTTGGQGVDVGFAKKSRG